MIRIVVTGSGGQLGRCIQKIAGNYSKFHFDFLDAESLNITDRAQVAAVFSSGKYQYCINCAAYTNVEQAEKTPDMAFAINSEGVRNLALAAKTYDTTMVHISTDYVFDGKKEGPYLSTDLPNPINEYGKSKLAGERHIQDIMEAYFIFRTSWLYSEFGHNFYKSIVLKAKKGETLYVTDAQIGCPTDANNLARYILKIISSQKQEYGIYHFTDGKAMTWFQFAKSILEQNGLTGKVILVKDTNYRTFAARPKNSVLK